MRPTTTTCRICGTAPATRKGEHIWPQWFLRRMDGAGPPPYAWAVNGEPVLDRDDQPIKRPQRQRVFLPVCEPCNGQLNTSIEVAAKSPIEQLARAHWSGSQSQADWRAVGVWWAKVLLLLGHPDARIGDDGIDQKVKRLGRVLLDEPLPNFGWLLTATPPAHLSTFVFNADLEASPETAHELVVPAVVTDLPGGPEYCHTLSIATPGLCVTVISHPGINIDHPMVRAGEAWELLHSPPPDGSDLSLLTPRSRQHVRIMRGGGVPAGHQVDESDHSRLTAMFDLRETLPEPGE